MYLPPTALTILERYPSSGLLHPILRLFFLLNDQDDSKDDEASETPPATSLTFFVISSALGVLWGNTYHAILLLQRNEVDRRFGVSYGDPAEFSSCYSYLGGGFKYVFIVTPIYLGK